MRVIVVGDVDRYHVEDPSSDSGGSERGFDDWYDKSGSFCRVVWKFAGVRMSGVLEDGWSSLVVGIVVVVIVSILVVGG